MDRDDKRQPHNTFHIDNTPAPIKISSEFDSGNLESATLISFTPT